MAIYGDLLIQEVILGNQQNCIKIYHLFYLIKPLIGVMESLFISICQYQYQTNKSYPWLVNLIDNLLDLNSLVKVFFVETS